MARLAINGGPKQINKPFPSWPVFDDAVACANGSVVVKL